MEYVVTQSVTGSETVDINFYRGDSLAHAISAMANASADAEKTDGYFIVNSVTLTVNR